MNKKYIVQKNEEIQEIIKNSRKTVNNFFVIYNKDNSLGYSRFCISVSKKIGKAHLRNLIKRRIKDILMKNKIQYSKDYVIIIRNAVLDIDYKKLESVLINTLKGEKI